MSLDEKHKEYEDNRKIIVVRDKGEKSEYRGNNDSEKLVAKYRVDGGLIEDGKKCDYLLLDKNGSIAYFIELKGSDLIKAIEQIESTIPQIKGDIAEYKINARIVLTKQRTPDLIDSKMRNFEGKIKKMGGTFKKANIKMEEQI